LTNPPYNTFEKQLIEITKKDFKIYNQEWAKNFCTINDTYPDCGETTARNLINLICFNGKHVLDIQMLSKFKPIPQLLDYYCLFNTFQSQSEVKESSYIYEEKLNARDAWSKLIINYAYNNINFLRSCNNKFGYELNAGLSKDNKISNFYQLIKNLLGIDSWDDLKKNNFVGEIQDNTNNGVGDIIIQHNNLGYITIHCMSGHYYMKMKNEKNININYSNFNPKQQSIIKILLKKIDISIDNYLWINFSSELLVEEINNASTNPDLKIKLLELSLTSQFE
jgi:hypothetical protein